MNLTNLTVDELLRFSDSKGFVDELTRRLDCGELKTPQQVDEHCEELESSYDAYAEHRYQEGRKSVVDEISKLAPNRKTREDNKYYYCTRSDLLDYIDSMLDKFCD